jgi:hypothetical protein
MPRAQGIVSSNLAAPTNRINEIGPHERPMSFALDEFCRLECCGQPAAKPTSRFLLVRQIGFLVHPRQNQVRDKRSQNEGLRLLPPAPDHMNKSSKVLSSIDPLYFVHSYTLIVGNRYKENRSSAVP